MRAVSLVAIVVVLGLVPATMAAPAKGNAEAGKKIYLESCQSCHGPTGKGDSDMAAYLTPPPADLTSKKTQSKKDGQLRKIIVEGVEGTAMSAFGEAFDDQQMADLIAYIRSVK
jgi:mono/diheme cytochrome c family protein